MTPEAPYTDGAITAAIIATCIVVLALGALVVRAWRRK